MRVAPATVLSASSSDALRRSTVTGVSRNVGSKIRLMLASRAIAVKTSRLLASRKIERRRHLDVRRQVEARRRQIARALDQRLELGLAFARDGDLGAQLVARRAQLLVDVAVGRVQLGGELVLDQRLIELAGGREAAAALK